MQRAKLQQNRRNSRRLNKTEKSESFLEPEEGLQEAFLFIILNRVSFLLPLRRAISSEKLYGKKYLPSCLVSVSISVLQHGSEVKRKRTKATADVRFTENMIMI